MMRIGDILQENVVTPDKIDDALQQQADGPEGALDPILKKSLTKLANGVKLNVNELSMVVATFKNMLAGENIQDTVRYLRLMKRHYK